MNQRLQESKKKKGLCFVYSNNNRVVERKTGLFLNNFKKIYILNNVVSSISNINMISSSLYFFLHHGLVTIIIEHVLE